MPFYLLKTKDLEAMGLNVDDSRDIIDMIMNIESVETAAVFREDADNEYKLSLRSKGIFPILEIAETVGGGGHPYASGASLRGNYTELKDQILQALEEKVKNHSK
ncbi:MAG: DHHA1 domain-containing protein [Bdellovibrionales bacterium]|nr:DHHA1 domain-containing protein [Bdellovibrionales bacterium]